MTTEPDSTSMGSRALVRRDRQVHRRQIPSRPPPCTSGSSRRGAPQAASLRREPASFRPTDGPDTSARQSRPNVSSAPPWHQPPAAFVQTEARLGPTLVCCGGWPGRAGPRPFQISLPLATSGLRPRPSAERPRRFLRMPQVNSSPATESKRIRFGVDWRGLLADSGCPVSVRAGVVFKSSGAKFQEFWHDVRETVRIRWRGGCYRGQRMQPELARTPRTRKRSKTVHGQP